MAAETRAIIGGQEIGLLFGLPAIIYIEKVRKEQTEGDTEADAIISMADIIYAGYMNYCKYERILMTLKFRDFCEYVELCGLKRETSEIKRIREVYDESMKIALAYVPDEKKSLKKSIGTKLKSSASEKTEILSESAGGNTSSFGADTTKTGLNSLSISGSLPIAL